MLPASKVLAMTPAWRLSLGCACGLLACAPDPEILPPLGEAFVVVDTDAPVPRIVSRLRIDIYDESGAWLDSREGPMRRREDWPATFSLFMDEGSPEKRVWVRLRAYRDGKLRDYRGERYEERPDGANPALIIEPPDGDGLPRLVRDGMDITPASEPIPALTIDRLLRLRLRDGERGAVRVVLRLACVGTMAAVQGGASCVDVENVRDAVTDAALDPDMTVPPSVGIGPLGAETPCALPLRPASFSQAGEPLYDEEVCVPGGTFLFGSPAFVLNAAAQEEPEAPPTTNKPHFNSTPERVAVMPPWLFDRHEVTVGRWRKAVEVDGFVPPDSTPVANEGALPGSAAEFTMATQGCTWSSLPRGREAHPITCISWKTARAFCLFYGSELPSEAAWEYAATAAGYAEEAAYPWGVEPPSCDRAVYGRVDNPALLPFVGATDCSDHAFGLQPVTANSSDATATGIEGLGGNVRELLLDSYRSYSSACWLAQGLIDPRCWQEEASHRAARGGSWPVQAGTLFAALRWAQALAFSSPYIGFRCARSGVQ